MLDIIVDFRDADRTAKMAHCHPTGCTVSLRFTNEFISFLAKKRSYFRLLNFIGYSEEMIIDPFNTLFMS